MANYTINFTDPTSTPVNVPAGSVNGPGASAHDTTLRLHGAGYLGWGEAVNENFVRLLENFMGATAPVDPVAGQLWVESKLYYRNTVGEVFYWYDIIPTSPTYQTWVVIAVTSQATAPTGVIGAYWFDTSTSKLKYFNSAYDNAPATWMERSLTEGVGAPVGTPVQQIKLYDANVGGWGSVSSVAISDSLAAPADLRVGSLRYSVVDDALYVWNGIGWDALISSGGGVFTGDLDVGNNNIINLANPVNPTDAVNKQYADTTYVNVSGDTMTGFLTLSGNPSAALHATTKQYVDGLITGGHTHTLANITDAGTAAAANLGVLSANVPTVSSIVGKHTIWVPAAAIIPRVTAGAGVATVETPTNKVSFKTLNFDTGVQEYAQFFVQMPKSWNESTVTVKFVWSHASTAVNFGVVWTAQGVAISNGDPLETAFGATQSISTVGGAADVLYSTSETPPFTISGSPVANDIVVFQISRSVGDVEDTLGIDARLHGVVLYYNTDALTDA